jgi:ABC-2 type transport system ATP-binding protein
MTNPKATTAMSIPVIDITDLTKFYGKDRGIEHIDLEIAEGEIFGFIGPNGAGKSTTIRLLLNMIFPSGGSARILGMDVIRDTKKIKRLTGYIPSDANTYTSMDVHGFLRYIDRFNQEGIGDQRIAELCREFDLDPDRKISDLSLGNRKKVSIVQSMLHSPRLLIADEPTTGLDPLMQSRFFELLHSENRRGMTIFYSSHILSEVQMICKRIAIIKEGKIIKVEDIENLRKKQLKKISIESEIALDEGDLPDPGMVSKFSMNGDRVTFMYSGDINGLIGFLAIRKITNLVIEEPSLEEIFMHYYK